MSNFYQYAETEFEGEKIAVCSGGFVELTYSRPSIAIIPDSLQKGHKISHEKLIEKNGYVKIKGKIYKNIGVNLNSNTLQLEKMDVPINELFSTQIGYHSFPYKGEDFTTSSPIISDQLKGKYVLLDFWATWCGPCIQEMPNLKALYEKTDREKFEIVGVVADSRREDLKKVIERDSIIWPQLFSNDSNNIKKTYGIQSYPTTLLLNPEGIIIEKHLRGKALEDKVLELIND